MRVAQREIGIVGERALAFDQAPGDIARHRLRDVGNLRRFRDHLAAVARVLHEAIDALVAAHADVSDGVDPEPRHVAPGDAAIEQFDLRRQFGEHGIERFVEQFEPRGFGVAQIDDHAGALGRLDARLAHGGLQAGRLGLFGLFAARAAFTSPHRSNFNSPA